MSLQAGQIIEGKYRIVRVLGQGGMGAVYEGENTRIHRRVAIKVLHASVAGKADIVQRFEREAQAAGRIGSEHIVEVLDLGSLPDGERFMVMEFLDGEPLGDRIKNRGKLDALESALILRQLLEGLGAAHAAGIVHRDLKPDNIFLLRSKGGTKDFVKLVDFGVSKFSALDAEFSMTRTGAVMGTPFYMSPEQARGQTVDHRSDLYSVGVVAYQMITGRVPFNADTFNELLFKIALESPEPAELLAPGLDPNFSAIVMRGMARDLNHRFQNAADFRGAVDGWLAQNGHAPHGGQPGHGASQQHSQPGYGNYPGALAQSGGGLSGGGTSSPQWGSSSGPTGSGANHPAIPMGSSQPGYGLSHSQAQQGHPQQGYPAHGQSQLGGSHPGPGSPGANLNQSQIAMAVTTGQPGRGGAVIAAVIAMVLLGVGGGIFAFKYTGAKAPVVAAGGKEGAAPEKSAELPKTDAAKVDGPPKTDPAKSDEPKPTDSGAAVASASAAPSAASPASDTTKVAAKTDPAAKPPTGQKPVGVKTPPPTPAGKDPPKPPPQTGRSIDGSL